MGDDAIVAVATAPNEPLAAMWVEALREAGIVAMLKPLGAGFGAWASAATMEQEISVRAGDEAAARAMLADLAAEDGDEDAGGAIGDAWRGGAG